MFWQKIKQGFLLFAVSVGLVLSAAFAFGYAQPAFAQNQPATPPAATPPAPAAAPDNGFLAQFKQSLTTGFTALVNLLILTVIKIIQYFMEFLAYLFSFVIEALKVVVNYRGFAEQKQVSTAWAIVRDLINGFFIVVLIAIAISTIIRFQQYNFRSTLPRLLLAALLVNFSKSICLLAISFANAVMGTFATALAQILPVYALGLRLPALTAFDSSSLNGLFDIAGAATALGEKKPVEMLSILVASIVGIIMMGFALGGVVMFLIILLFRIIVLWFLIILSPLAFFLWGVPGRAGSYWGQWLEEFVKHLIIGPIGAFFLYIIAYFYVANIKSAYDLKITASLPVPVLTQGATPNILMGYLISLGMMFIALEIIEQFGVRGGQFARSIGVEKIAKGTLSALRGGAGIAADLATKYTGVPLSYTRAIDGITGGLTAKRERLAKDAILSTEKTAKSLIGSRAGFLAPAYAFASGNEELIKSMGIGDMFRMGKATIQGKNELKTEYNKEKNHQAAYSGFNSLDADTKSYVGGMTKSQLGEAVSAIAGYNAYKGKIQQRSSLQGQLRDEGELLNGLATAQLTGDADIIKNWTDAIADNNRIKAQIQTADADIAAYEAANDQPARDALESVAGKEADLRKLSEALNKSGVEIKDGANIGTIENREAQLKKVVAEFKRRQKFEGLAVSEGRSEITSKMRDHIKGTYDRDVKYGTDDIYSNMLMNKDKTKREAFAGDLAKAGEMGKFDDILLKMGYDASPERVKAFVNEVLIKELGFEEQDALTILADVQGRTNKASQNYVKLDGVTQDFNFLSHEGEDGGEHAAALEGRVKNAGAYNALKSFKLDGLGHYDANKNFTFNKGAVRGIRDGGIKALIADPGKLNDIDANAKRELLKIAGDLGLNDAEKSALEKATK